MNLCMGIKGLSLQGLTLAKFEALKGNQKLSYLSQYNIVPVVLHGPLNDNKSKTITFWYIYKTVVSTFNIALCLLNIRERVG
jgi:hypothetical protein